MSQPMNISIRVPLPKEGAQLPRERPERLRLYVDETDFHAEDGRQLRGVGVLSVPAPVGQDLIDRAMYKLRNDPERKGSQDQRTLDDGYFHASLDGPNAHSPLSEEIAACVHGNFVAAFIEAGTRSDREAYRSNAVRAILTTLKGRTPARCTFEQWGNFSQLQAKDLIEYMNEGLGWSSYETTMLRAFYPHIEVKVVGKKDPGVQVTDLLLWSFMQEKFHLSSKKAVWAKRCGLFCWADVPSLGDQIQWSQCTVNNGSPMDRHDPDSLIPYPVQFGDIGEAAYPDSYALGESTVRRYARSPLPSHAEHLRPGLVQVLARLEDPDRVGPEQIRDVANQFLRLFDTVPVYEGMSDTDSKWLPLVRAKRFLALTLRELLLYGGVADFLRQSVAPTSGRIPPLSGCHDPKVAARIIPRVPDKWAPHGVFRAKPACRRIRSDAVRRRRRHSGRVTQSLRASLGALPNVDHAAASGFDHAPAKPETCRRPRTCRPVPRERERVGRERFGAGNDASRIRRDTQRDLRM
jgi:hypothetical protein